MPENDWFVVQRGPRFRERTSSRVIDAELQSIEGGFARLPDRNKLAGNVQVGADETAASAANVYVLASEYPITTPLKGTVRRWFVAHTNTGTSTIDVDGTGAKELRNIDNSVLSGQELIATWPAEIQYDGTRWRLMNSAKAVVATIILQSSLDPQNYERNVDITPLVLPAAGGGAAPYTYAAAGLPTGLAFAAATRTVSGRPTVVGVSQVGYTVTDANNRSFTFQFQIRVVEQVLFLADPPDRTLTAGQQAEIVVTAATGGTGPYTYTIQGLPIGLAFDPDTRRISGIPAVPSVYPVTVSVSDSGVPQQTASQHFELTVRSASPLNLADPPNRIFEPDTGITPIILPPASGGVPGYTYIVTGLGEGLAFNPLNRVIEGTPTQLGLRNVVYRARDSVGTIVEQSFTITIARAGRRYIAVSIDQSISAADLTTGNDYPPNQQTLTLPTWSGNRYIVISQPEDNDDLTSISLAGLGNAISSFMKLGYTRTVNGVQYEIWVSNDVQGGVISGEALEVRP